MYQDSLPTVSAKMLVKMFAILTVEEKGLHLQMTEVGRLSEQEAKEETLPRPEETFITYAPSTDRAGVGEKAFQQAVGLSHWHIWVLAEDKILNCR